MIHQKQILWFDRHVTLACDGQCSKAWGISTRPKVEFDPDADTIERHPKIVAALDVAKEPT